MKHLTEEEWIEHYYGESNDSQAVQQHLTECSECAAMGQELARDLAAMREREGEPLRDGNYGEKVWQSLRSSLTPYRREQTGRWYWPLRWNLGLTAASVTLAAIAVAAFYSGRLWEQRSAPQIAAANQAHAGDRIILFVVSDHLDRSQKLLAELNDPDQAAADHGLQATARELLTENRLYRQSSRRDPAVAQNASLETILDDLEPALIELANQPGDLDRAKIVQLRRELNTGGLLFEIHVLRSRAHQQEQSADAPQEGTI